MAGTSPPRYPPALLCIYYNLLICIQLPYASASSFAFNFSSAESENSPCFPGLVCRGEVTFANQILDLTRNDMTRYSNNSRGRVWYERPVQLWDAGTNELASFATTFAFKITPDERKKSNGLYNLGDGMAFFLAPYSAEVLNTTSVEGGYLGLFSDSNSFNATGDSSVVAVEFDTFPNTWDNGTQHIGIDVNSIKSAVYTDTSVVGNMVINLTSDVMMIAKINYDNRTRLLAVDLDIDGYSYHVNDTVDLKLLLPEKVAVDFSAATGWAAELHRVSFWSFDSSLNDSSSFIPPDSSSSFIPPIKSEPSTKLVLKVLLPILAVSVCAAVGLLLWLRQKRRRRHVQLNNGGASGSESSDEQHGEAEFERGMAGPRRFRFRELTAATNDFDDQNKLGRGGFGSVYHGNIVQGDGSNKQVAVKKFSSETSSQGRKEFEAEVKIISRLRHRKPCAAAGLVR